VPIRVASAIKDAIAQGHAVVALESTVVTHGLPAPQNLELALDLERIVREAGAHPATVGVLDGDLVVGLSEQELARLATGGAEKATLWNLAALMAFGQAAGTTVATTLHAAHLSGISVFATGGIGGVHDEPFDESADLAALARTPVITVCAGPKSILNAEATLERLETAGVPVLGYRSNRLAGFHVPLTDLPVSARLDTPEDVAATYRNHRELGLDQALLVSNPVSEGFTRETYAAWLEQAREAAAANGIRGHATTPFLLDALAKASQGATVDVNLRLLRENTQLASEIAHAVASTRSGVLA